MKTLSSILFLFVSAFLYSQEPVKKDLMPMFDQCTVPPPSCKDAFAKVIVDKNGGTTCSAEKLFQAITKEAKEFEEEYKKSAATSLQPGMPPPGGEQNEKEMRKKMKSMSKEDRMKMAMEMSKNMQTNGSAMAPDPPSVREALDEWQNIYNNTQSEYERGVAIQQEENRIREEQEKAHSEIDEWEKSEISKLPQITSGEMSAPDPVKVKAVKLKAADKHIAVANKWLEETGKRWHTYVNYTKNKWKKFYEKLIAAGYGADSKNFSTKKTLSDAQMMIYKELMTDIQLSRNAWEEAGSWQARKKNVEEMKVD